ncbi:olfactory receptor 10V1-like [Eublepharis macularius]|uniref:Olfactory receptor n=1 Tax=Eublepharis macularius TaxID=481883 RepID=A0AA97KN23_EUBMA|nr:olfactory receptor 10V1-like [Eublepharis macularius]
MSPGNHSAVMEFVFLAFPINTHQQVLVFIGMFLIYIAIILGNLLILVAVCGEPHLHTPMYFFLGSLSVMELCYTTSVVPQMLVNILQERKSITTWGCGTQMFFFIALGSADSFLLVVMAYDRYVAICQPLHYAHVMTWQRCTWLVAISLILGGLMSMEIVILIFHLPFNGSNKIEHFFCDVNQLLKLASADTSFEEIAQFVGSIFILTVPFLLIAVSYICIIMTVLQIPSTKGRIQTFNTCSSHLMVVLLQYGCGSLVYLHPKSRSFDKMDRLLSLVYIFGTPILNPIIYSLRNKELKDTIRKLPLKVKLGNIRETEQPPLCVSLLSLPCNV